MITLHDVMAGHSLPARIQCPIEDDRRANAIIYEEGTLYCFKCGLYAADAVDLIRLWQFRDQPYRIGRQFAEAYLERFGLAFTPRLKPPMERDPAVTATLTLVSQFASARLARDTTLTRQIAHERGLHDPVGLGLGLVEPAMLTPIRQATKPIGDPDELLVKAGVIRPVHRNWGLGRRIFIPQQDAQETIFYQARTLESGHPIKYLNPSLPRPLFGHLQGSEYVWIGEGPFDILPLLESGESALAGMGADIAQDRLVELVDLIGTKEAIVIFDDDPTGRSKGHDLVEHLTNAGIIATFVPPDPPYKDYGEWIARVGVEQVKAQVIWSL